jgi:hypothetical protein
LEFHWIWEYVGGGGYGVDWTQVSVEKVDGFIM